MSHTEASMNLDATICTDTLDMFTQQPVRHVVSKNKVNKLVAKITKGIPDEAAYEMEAARKAPSWRRVCKSLLRNDYWGKGMGFSQHKSDAYQKYLDLMKRRREAWGVKQGALGFEVDDE